MNRVSDPKIKEEISNIMGGQILEYQAKTIKNQIEEKVFYNMIKSGYSIDEAIRISEISPAKARRLINKSR